MGRHKKPIEEKKTVEEKRHHRNLYMKKYYQMRSDQRDRHNELCSKFYQEKNSMSLKCACGGKYRPLFLYLHAKTKKHNNYLESLKSINQI
jgi:predicted peptidase